MSREKREESWIVVTVPDLTEVSQGAVEYYNKSLLQESQPPATEADHQRWGYVKRSDGKVFALCTEGVGQSTPITEKSGLEIDFYVGGSFRPQVHQTLLRSELLALPVAEIVPLHEFIRSFGSRLESNYFQWKSTLEHVPTQRKRRKKAQK